MKVIGEREDYIFKKKVKELTNNEYKVIGTYKGVHQKILFQHNCKKCNNFQFLMRPHDFLRGQRCPYCMKHHKKTTDDIKREIQEKFSGSISLLTEYTDPRKKIIIRCNKCGRIRKIFPYTLLESNEEEVCICKLKENIINIFKKKFNEYNIKYKENFKIKSISNSVSTKFDSKFHFHE